MSGTPSILINPEIQGGTPCFAGTARSRQILVRCFRCGRSVDYFLQQFPSVRPEQVRDVLEQAERLVREHASHAA